MKMQRHSKIKMISAWLFCVVFCCFGFYVGVCNLSQGAMRFYEIKMARYWPKTKATIVSTKVEAAGGRGSHWIPLYTYTYTVNNKQYINNRLSIGPSLIYDYVEDAQFIVTKHPVGSELLIRYNPASPESSTIYISIDSGFTNFMQGVVGLLISIVFATVLFYLLRPNKKIQQESAT